MSDQNTQTSEQPTEVKPGSEEYNKEMADKFQSQEAEPTQEEVPIQGMPEGGADKFYNKETGEYDWKNHAKELQYKIDQSNQQQTPEQPQQTNANRYNYNMAYEISAYSKGAVFLAQLGYIIGEEKLKKTLKEYFKEFKI